MNTTSEVDKLVAHVADFEITDGDVGRMCRVASAQTLREAVEAAARLLMQPVATVCAMLEAGETVVWKRDGLIRRVAAVEVVDCCENVRPIVWFRQISDTTHPVAFFQQIDNEKRDIRLSGVTLRRVVAVERLRELGWSAITTHRWLGDEDEERPVGYYTRREWLVGRSVGDSDSSVES